jgi:hypothetical protein
MGLRKRFLILLAAAVLPVMIAAAADAAVGGDCLACHGTKSILEQGANLFVDPAKYALTTHARIGCSSCHVKVTARHPADGIRPSRAKCQECHANVFAEYNQSPHSKNAGCADCHNPHTVKPLLSVSGRDINIQCAKCHTNSKIVQSHAKWLPQAALHIDALPCITCHTGSPNYVITMYLAKNISESPRGVVHLADFKDLQPFLAGQQKVGTLIDINGDGAVSLDELISFNKSGKYSSMSILGTMMPESVTHSYQIMNNRWDCTFCHASGPKVQQASYLAFPEQDGTYSRLPVEKGAILDILYGTPDFYMTGFTRNKTLSIIGILIAAGGLLVPIVHGSLRFLTRHNRKEQ